MVTEKNVSRASYADIYVVVKLYYDMLFVFEQKSLARRTLLRKQASVRGIHESQLLNVPEDQGWYYCENTCFLPFWPGYILNLGFSCRLSLLSIRAFTLDVFLQVLLVFILIKLTFRIPITCGKPYSGKCEVFVH